MQTNNPDYHKFDHLVKQGTNLETLDKQYSHLLNCRLLMQIMYHELKAHGLKAYKDAFIKKTKTAWIFNAPSLNFKKEFSKAECANTYQARYEGWLSYLDERGLLKKHEVNV